MCRFHFRTLPVLLLIMLALLLVPAWNQSWTYNENGRLASGLIYLRFGDYSIFHVNPPLVNSIGAVPAAIANAHCPERKDLGFSSFGRSEYRAGILFDKFNDNHRLLIFSGRSMCILLVILCVPVYYTYAGKIYGKGSSLAALLILIFSPWILGYAPLIVPDVPSALLALLSLFCFRLWLKDPKWDNVFLAGFALGIAELSKFTLLIFYPLFIFMPLYQNLWVISGSGKSP
ncbi:MAG: glycosyltransferase family 39 protein, partial [Fibrobacter sp.]|nr:glycosyltransferase family 39 protein [Fibrobacter sp.]